MVYFDAGKSREVRREGPMASRGCVNGIRQGEEATRTPPDSATLHCADAAFRYAPSGATLRITLRVQGE